jgi:hypothetical protein
VSQNVVYTTHRSATDMARLRLPQASTKARGDCNEAPPVGDVRAEVTPSTAAPKETTEMNKLLKAKIAAAAGATVLAGASAAAATTGSLPAPVQSAVDHGLSSVGLTLAASHHDSATTSTTASTSTTEKADDEDATTTTSTTAKSSTTPSTTATTAGPNSTSPTTDGSKGPDLTATSDALHGLCVAYSHNSDSAKAHSAAMMALVKAAGGADKVATFCTPALDSKTSSSTSSTTSSTVKSGQATTSTTEADHESDNSSTSTTPTTETHSSSANSLGVAHSGGRA